MTGRRPSGKKPKLACPVCGYDLAGLPEDRCPECGVPFDRAELLLPPPPGPLEQALADPMIRHGPLALCIAVSVLCRPHREPLSAWLAIWFVLAWGAGGAWLAMHRTGLLRERPAALLWLLIPAAATAFACGAPEILRVQGTVLGALIGAAVLVVSFRRAPRASAAALCLALALTATPVGGFLAGHAAMGLAAGHYWSPWDAPVEGGRIRAVPYHEAFAFGRTVLLAGIAGIAGYFVARPAGRRE